MMTDKLNHVDYHWYLVRTQPGHEQELGRLINREKATTRNILEAYCPTHTTVNVRLGDEERKLPLFDGYVFVLATQGALLEFLHDRYPNAFLRYKRKRTPNDKATPFTIPEEQMRAFMDYNDNYADKVVVLERPFTDYAFNPNEDNQPNEIVRVLDGPLAGREGYICRFRRKRGLVFQVQGIEPGSHLTVSYPNVYDLHVIRLHNAEGDRLSLGTEKARAIDLLVGTLQGCGYGERTLPALYDLIDRLAAKPSLTALFKELRQQGHEALSLRLSRMTGQEAQLLLNLARLEQEHPGSTREAYPKLILRPFLTPTSGLEEGGSGRQTRPHFTELTLPVPITEQVYYPSRQTGVEETTPYYAHLGLMEREGHYILFANWDTFLGEYFLTAGKANEKLVEGKRQQERPIDSFRIYAPILYKVLTDPDFPVKAIQDFPIGDDRLHVMATTATNPEQGAEELLRVCVGICQELNTTNHLAVWRRYLRTVWLHS